jgi:hypothetical protein
MKPSHIAQALNHCVQIKRPVFLWGPPGVGKSDVVAQVAKARNMELRDVRLSLLDPVDLKGFPVADKANAQMSWLPPDFLPPMESKNEGILFLDELVSAPPAVQAAAYQLILDRKIGNYVLPDGWAMVAAGNRAGDRAVVHRMPSALRNRLIHLDFEINVEDWVEWGQKHDMCYELLAFIRFRPELLHKFNPTEDPRQFPTPRSWMFVNQLYKSRLSTDIETALIIGAVGEGAAIEFLAFARMADQLPTFEQILKDPNGVAVPHEPSAMYAVTTMLSMRTESIAKQFEPGFDYMLRLPLEYQTLYVQDLIRRHGEKLLATPKMTQWAMKHANTFVRT